MGDTVVSGLMVFLDGLRYELVVVVVFFFLFFCVTESIDSSIAPGAAKRGIFTNRKRGTC